MRIVAAVRRLRNGAHRRAELTKAASAGWANGERMIVADLRLPASSVLNKGDNANMSLTDDDLAGLR